jgi:dephospho-CoA kinase
MLNVALTGNIAAGKSTVVALFRRWGATVIDADALVREVEAPGTPVLAAIARRFGPEVLSPDGTLDRAALRTKVLADNAALTALNALVHPAVERRREALVDAAWKRGDRIVVNDIPLLFEALDPDRFDVVVLVDAPVGVRRARLEGLRGLTAEAADRMIAAQLAPERKRKRSQYVIDNDGTLEDLERGARAVYDDLERRAAAKEQA